MDVVQIYFIIVTSIAALLLLLALIVPAVQLKRGTATPEQAGERRTLALKKAGKFCFWAFLAIPGIIVITLVKLASNNGKSK